MYENNVLCCNNDPINLLTEIPEKKTFWILMWESEKGHLELPG